MLNEERFFKKKEYMKQVAKLPNDPELPAKVIEPLLEEFIAQWPEELDFVKVTGLSELEETPGDEDSLYQDDGVPGLVIKYLDGFDE